MKIIKPNRINIAWLLAVLFIIPLILKPVHIQENECGKTVCSHTKEKENNSDHNCNTCAICQFTFSSFTESSLFTPDLVEAVSFYNIPVLYKEKGYNSISHPNYLRAPPANI